MFSKATAAVLFISLWVKYISRLKKLTTTEKGKVVVILVVIWWWVFLLVRRCEFVHRCEQPGPLELSFPRMGYKILNSWRCVLFTASDIPRKHFRGDRLMLEGHMVEIAFPISSPFKCLQWEKPRAGFGWLSHLSSVPRRAWNFVLQDAEHVTKISSLLVWCNEKTMNFVRLAKTRRFLP